MADLLVGDVRSVLPQFPDGHFQTIITSPPYWGLRDYKLEPSIWGGDPACAHAWQTEQFKPQSGGTGAASAKQVTNRGGQGDAQQPKTRGFCSRCGAWCGCLGLEPTPQLYVEHITTICHELWRVLHDDGIFWLNLGDSYVSNPKKGGVGTPNGRNLAQQGYARASLPSIAPGLKPKDLCGIPWRVAFALQADGWYLRSDIIYAKPNPMPESVRDRPTRAHEYLFLLTKREKYYYDWRAVAEPARTEPKLCDKAGEGYQADYAKGQQFSLGARVYGERGIRNRRSVWTITPKPYRGAHFATFPPALVEPCVLAGSKSGDRVLDPFCGSGTVGLVCQQHGREFTGVDAQPAYIEMAQQRLANANSR